MRIRKPSIDTEPQLTAEQAISLLKSQKAQAEALLQQAIIREEEIRPWCAATQSVLIAALGEDRARSYLSLVSRANWQEHGPDFFTDVEEAQEEAQKDIRNGLKGAISVLTSCIQLLETRAPSSKELEQKFKILYSAAQAKRDFEAWKLQPDPLGHPLALIFIDIDHFKTLNMRYTETVIDLTVLPEAQRLLARVVKGRGEAYRQGGDEFILILPNHERSECEAFAERLRRTFERYFFSVRETKERLTISSGFALYPEDGSTYEEVLQRANEAERNAKASRNRVGSA